MDTPAADTPADTPHRVEVYTATVGTTRLLAVLHAEQVQREIAITVGILSAAETMRWAIKVSRQAVRP